MDITPAGYQKWRDEIFTIEGGPKSRGIAPMTAFKDDLIEDIETKLSDAMEEKRAGNYAFSRKSTRSKVR